jgi:signal transduction histidine kinase
MPAHNSVRKVVEARPLPMVEKAAASYALLFLMPENGAVWFRDLSGHMAKTGYQVVAVERDGGYYKAVRAKKPDAVVAMHDADCLQVFERLEQDTSRRPRPLRVLIIEDSWNEALNIPVDLVLPASPQGLNYSLQAALRARANSLALYERNAALEAEVERQRVLLHEQQVAADEVTLLKNAIVRNVSHELKTPLLHVKSAVAMMAEDNANNTLSQYATEATARLEAVVKNIAQLASSLDLQIGPVLVREVVDQAVRNLRRSWQIKEAVSRVHVEIADDLPPVLGDKQGLSTVIQLLLDNALKFSEKPVEIVAVRVGEEAQVTVRDYGIGIAQDEMTKIFDSFYQVDSSSTRRYGGTGVGLAIVRLILDRHKVHIDVKSEEGEGSTFTFKLKFADLHADAKTFHNG